jgi:pimeloyl-ACP methyl ester carboxylesterase
MSVRRQNGAERGEKSNVMSSTSKDAATSTVAVDGTAFAYREVGPATGVPVVFLHHFTAVLDDWDPAVVDGIATERHVILVDLRGVGGSGGATPDNVEAVAAAAIAFIEALGRCEPACLGAWLVRDLIRDHAKHR